MYPIWVKVTDGPYGILIVSVSRPHQLRTDQIQLTGVSRPHQLRTDQIQLTGVVYDETMSSVTFLLMLFCLSKGDNSTEIWISSGNDLEDGEDDLEYKIRPEDDLEYKIRPKFTYRNNTVLVGSKLELGCSLKAPCNECDINKLRIVHCPGGTRDTCSVVDTSIQDDHMITLIKNNVSVEDRGSYFCQYSGSSSQEADIYIFVGNKPVGPVDIRCVSLDLQDLVCSWKMSKEDEANHVPVQYHSYLSMYPRNESFDCPEPSPKRKPDGLILDLGCSLPMEYVELSPHRLPNYPIYLYINITSTVGGHTVQYVINPVQIVKLSPPSVALSRSEDRTMTLELNLSCNTRPKVPWLKSVVYQVFYSSDYSNNMRQFKTSNSTSLITLSNLTPYIEYTVRVRVRGVNSIGEDYWGTAEPVIFRTLAAAPQALPLILGYGVVDGYINIYIQPIHKAERYSKDANYSVNLTSVMERTYEVSWDTVTMENVTRMTSAGFQVELKTVNNKGQSKNTTFMAVPPYQPDKLVPENVVVEGSDTAFIVSWETITMDIKNVIVYWCVGHQAHCQSDIHWMNVLPNITEVSLTTGIPADWIFAVSFVYYDEYTTEMVFSQCHFPSINQGSTGVAVYSIEPKERQLVVKPGEYCSKKYHSKPIMYTVYYSQSSHEIKSCDTSFSQKTVKALMKQREIIIDDLSPGVNYYVCMGVLLKGNQSVISDPQKIQTLSEASSPLVIIVVVIIVTLAVMLVLILAWKLMKKYRKEDSSIDLPKINVEIKRATDYTHLSNGSEKVKRQYSDDSGIETLSSGGTPSVVNEAVNRNHDYIPELVVKPTETYKQKTGKLISSYVEEGFDSVKTRSDLDLTQYVSEEHETELVVKQRGTDGERPGEPISSYVEGFDSVRTRSDNNSVTTCEAHETEMRFNNPQGVCVNGKKDLAAVQPHKNDGRSCKEQCTNSVSPYVTENPFAEHFHDQNEIPHLREGQCMNSFSPYVTENKFAAHFHNGKEIPVLEQEKCIKNFSPYVTENALTEHFHKQNKISHLSEGQCINSCSPYVTENSLEHFHNQNKIPHLREGQCMNSCSPYVTENSLEHFHNQNEIPHLQDEQCMNTFPPYITENCFAEHFHNENEIPLLLQEKPVNNLSPYITENSLAESFHDQNEIPLLLQEKPVNNLSPYITENSLAENFHDQNEIPLLQQEKDVNNFSPYVTDKGIFFCNLSNT